MNKPDGFINGLGNGGRTILHQTDLFLHLDLPRDRIMNVTAQFLPHSPIDDVHSPLVPLAASLVDLPCIRNLVLYKLMSP